MSYSDSDYSSDSDSDIDVRNQDDHDVEKEREVFDKLKYDEVKDLRRKKALEDERVFVELDAEMPYTEEHLKGEDPDSDTDYLDVSPYMQGQNYAVVSAFLAPLTQMERRALVFVTEFLKTFSEDLGFDKNDEDDLVERFLVFKNENNARLRRKLFGKYPNRPFEGAFKVHGFFHTKAQVNKFRDNFKTARKHPLLMVPIGYFTPFNGGRDQALSVESSNKLLNNITRSYDKNKERATRYFNYRRAHKKKEAETVNKKREDINAKLQKIENEIHEYTENYRDIKNRAIEAHKALKECTDENRSSLTTEAELTLRQASELKKMIKQRKAHMKQLETEAFGKKEVEREEKRLQDIEDKKEREVSEKIRQMREAYEQYEIGLAAAKNEIDSYKKIFDLSRDFKDSLTTQLDKLKKSYDESDDIEEKEMIYGKISVISDKLVGSSKDLGDKQTKLHNIEQKIELHEKKLKTIEKKIKELKELKEDKTSEDPVEEKFNDRFETNPDDPNEHEITFGMGYKTNPDVDFSEPILSREQRIAAKFNKDKSSDGRDVYFGGRDMNDDEDEDNRNAIFSEKEKNPVNEGLGKYSV